MKSNILNKRGKKTQNKIKYVFNKYKIWIKLQNKKEKLDISNFSKDPIGLFKKEKTVID